MDSENVNEAAFHVKLRGIQSDLVKQIQKDEMEAELLAKRVQKNRQLLHAVNGSLGALTAQATGFSRLSDTIRSVIAELPQDRFTAPDIEQILTAKFPTVPLDKPGVRTTLWNMMKRAEIMCTRKGNNRQPAEYSRLTTAGGTASEAPRGRLRLRRLAPANGEEPN